MAGTNCVHARAFHDLKLPFDAAKVDGRTQRAQVPVVADALNPHMASVQQEAFVLVEGDGADAERRL